MFYLIGLQENKIVHKSEQKQDFGGAWGNPGQYYWIESSSTFIDPIYEGGKIIEGKSLDDLKQLKYAELDAKTEEIISKGFTYNTKTFSLSLEAQARMTAVAFSDSVLGITPPAGIPWNTIDDKEVYVVPKAKVLEFCTTGFYTIQQEIFIANSYKDMVRAMTDKEEVKAFRDPRKQTGEK